MTRHTKRSVDAAVDELKREGYMVLLVMLDQKEEPCCCRGIFQSPDCKAHKGKGVEVLCSETNDPKLLAAMLKTTLEQLSGEAQVDRQVN